MSITRINEFQAAEGKEETLLNFLKKVVGMVKDSPGNLGCQLLQKDGEPTYFTILEEWENIEAHVAAVKAIPPESMQEAMPLLGAPPKGSYFHPRA